MKPFGLFVTLFLAALAACQSQNATYIAQQVAQISPCGLSCLELTVPQVGCGLLNTTCQCASKELFKITSQCMLVNCTLEQSVELDKIQADICELPSQSRNKLIRITTIVCMIITYISVGARLATRHYLHQYYRLDDWFIIAAMCTDTVFAGFGIAIERHGFGEHAWEINPNLIPRLLYWFYVCEIFYLVTIGLVKVSILTFYLQVFPTRTFRTQCWTVMVFCVISAFAFLVVTIFQCHPVSYAWNRTMEGGKCVNFNTVTWVNGAINIFQDFLIIGLPVSEVRKLQLGKKKKGGLYIMFGLGVFVCVTSIVRLYSIKTFGITSDATWDNIPITFWSTLETTTAMLCSCLPTIRAGLLRLIPQGLDSTVHPSNHTPTGTGNKSTIVYQKSFCVSSVQSKNLGDESSIDERLIPWSRHSKALQELELAKLRG